MGGNLHKTDGLPPSETEQFSQLVGRIYDAALDPELWPSVLERCCTFVPGSMGNIYSQDAVDQAVNRYFTWGHDPQYATLYMEKYAALNPLVPALLFFPAGEVYATADIVSDAEMRETRFYKEWLEPQGYVDFIACNLDKTATSVAPFTIVRHQRDGFVDEETRRRMRLIAPHVRRSILIGKAIDLKIVEVAALADTLDRLSAAVYLVNSDGRLVHANAAGHSLISARIAVHAPEGRLTATDPQAGRALRESIVGATAGDAALGTKGISLPLPGPDGQDYVAHVLPLASRSRQLPQVSSDAAAAVFVRKAVLDLRSPLEVVTRRYQLTAGELRILVALLNVGKVSQIADALGISEGTVRNHLHSLFEKTGTARQSDLVKLVGGYGSPLVS